MPEGYFSIKRDNSLIAAGTHFWCEGCVVARPLDDQSPDPRYCQGCFGVLKVEATMQPTRKAPWTRVAASNRKATVKPLKQQEPVAKIETPTISPITEKQGIMQHPGRPRKAGEVHRVTKWRRDKQGVLV